MAQQYSLSTRSVRLLHSETCRWFTDTTNVSCGSILPVGRMEKPPFALAWRSNGRWPTHCCLTVPSSHRQLRPTCWPRGDGLSVRCAQSSSAVSIQAGMLPLGPL